MVPLLYPEALPLIHANSSVLMPPPSGGPPRPPSAHQLTKPATPVAERDPIVRMPLHIPDRISMTPEPLQPRAADNGPYVPFAVPGDGPGRTSAILTELIGAPVHATIKPPHVSSLRVSQGVSQGMLIARVEPKYPDLARIARIQGDVVLAATIGRDGRIENLHVVSGHPMLARAAVDAVSQWRYRPYMLGREAVEVETQITVRFTLAN
jgi:periplasmic protein TonB